MRAHRAAKSAVRINMIGNEAVQPSQNTLELIAPGAWL
jgi:hypothetical protein